MFILICLHRYTCKRMCEYTDLERDVYICVFMYISMVIQTSLCDNCLNLKLNGFSPTVGHYLMTFELWLKFRCIAVFFVIDLWKGQEFLCQVALECAMPQATADMEGERSSVASLRRYQQLVAPQNHR